MAEKEATYAAARIAGIDCLELLAEIRWRLRLTLMGGESGEMAGPLSLIWEEDLTLRLEWRTVVRGSAVDGTSARWSWTGIKSVVERLLTGLMRVPSSAEDSKAALSTEVRTPKRNLSVREVGKVQTVTTVVCGARFRHRSAFEEVTLTLLCA